MLHAGGVKASDFFALPASLEPFASSFPGDVSPWEWLNRLGPALALHQFLEPLPPLPPGVHVEGHVFIHPTVKLPPTATIIGPAWIGANTEIRPGAYIRGSVIVGENCVLGNSCEFKYCMLMNRVQTPHFNYIGDSILGNGAHFGAGVICSNVRLDQKNVVIHLPDGGVVDTGRKKFGAIVGDRAEVGCNAVLQPGTLLGTRSLVMPLTAFGGYLPPATIAHSRQQVTTLPRRD
jgi:carbonic anhydrase/acetyltransferase-like protein (isoleucine patch superfamily)